MTKDNSQNSTNIPSLILESSNSTKPNIGENTTINNFLVKKYDDTNIWKIKFTNPENKKFTIKEFIKTDKVSSLFDYVEKLGKDMHSKQNFGAFDLIHGYPQRQLSQVKNKSLMEECLTDCSEVFIIYLSK